VQFIFGCSGPTDGGTCGPVQASVEQRYGPAVCHLHAGGAELFGCDQDPRDTSGRAVLAGFVANPDALRALGARGDTHADLLVSAYDQFGIEAFDRVHGQYSVAIWDPRKRRVLVARDRMGIYPVYVTVTNGFQYFSSDYKSLLALETVSTEPDLQTVQFFHHSGWVPRGGTFLKAVRTAPPGTVSILENGRCRVLREIPLPQFDTIEYDIDLNTAAVQEELRRAVSAYWPGGPAVGATLSSGIDSSHLAAELVRQCAERDAELHTFTVGYGENDPEILGARETSRFLGTSHHEVIVRPPDLASLWPEAIWHLEDPVGRDQYPCVMALARTARPIVDTLFYANGPDTTYGGLADHHALAVGNRHPRLRTAIEDLLTYQRSSTAPRDRLGELAVRRYGEPGLPTPALPLPAGAALKPRIHLPESVHAYMAEELREYDGHLGMKHQLIRSAANINARMPLYAEDIYKLSSRIPDAHKVDLHCDKIVWRKAAAALLPSGMCNRPKGIQHLDYGAEYSDMMDGFAHRTLSSARVAEHGILPPDVLSRLLRRPGGQPYGAKHLYRIWYAVATELWCQIFMDFRGRTWRPIGDAPPS
jgi:asparagine synthase (glutamine-hydrolysing)